MLQVYPKINQLLEGESDRVGGAYNPAALDPDHSNALATGLWELALLGKHSHPRVAEWAGVTMKLGPMVFKECVDPAALVDRHDPAGYEDPRLAGKNGAGGDRHNKDKDGKHVDSFAFNPPMPMSKDMKEELKTKSSAQQKKAKWAKKRKRVRQQAESDLLKRITRDSIYAGGGHAGGAAGSAGGLGGLTGGAKKRARVEKTQEQKEAAAAADREAGRQQAAREAAESGFRARFNAHRTFEREIELETMKGQMGIWRPIREQMEARSGSGSGEQGGAGGGGGVGAVGGG